MRRILFIDAYDSFTNNIASLIEIELGAKVTTIRIDDDIEDLGQFLAPFDAVVAGPGPGSPQNPRDVGLISRLWALSGEQLKPVLGICLGFQSLVYTFGGVVERLSRARHGISTRIETKGTGLFEGLDRFESIQYHSLRASVGQIQDQWQPSQACPELMPLAWDRSLGTDDPILMGVSHVSRPFWGIQFHPESICSSMEARKVVRNWWDLCKQAHSSEERHSNTIPLWIPYSKAFPIDDDYPSEGSSTYSTSTAPDSRASRSQSTSYTTTREATPIEDYVCKSTPLGDLCVCQIVDRLHLGGGELIVLDSERKLLPGLGRYSIIGIIEPVTTKIAYQIGSKQIKTMSGRTVCKEPTHSIGSVFTFLKRFLNQRKLSKGSHNIPFWGGLLGYVDYEACLESIGIHAQGHATRDNLCFAFVERSIVIDHLYGVIYVQTIKQHDHKWTEMTLSQLSHEILPTSPVGWSPKLTCVRLPIEKNYKLKIDHCQEQIRAGNSYELCLTNQATFTTRKSEEAASWQQYQRLRLLNPAPFGSYMRLGGATILSTSPERFMSWSRPSLNERRSVSSLCQFRPIKGTVQKEQVLSDGSTRRIGLQEATSILSTVKETAENLMIVDLIRHDLHGVAGSGNVRVPSLMKVEEYSTVYQLVSVIEGDLQSVPGDENSKSGIDVLAASLPPGSMTGAPKKRSCELLKDVEDEPRSIYSGVIGYMCVGGGGDFSVTIRTIFKWDDEDDGDRETWRIGAGGAITILSDLQGEWDEMRGKLRSTQRLFE